MGWFDFLKPKKIQDDFFGELVCVTFKKPPSYLFEGSTDFKPLVRKVGVTINSALPTPSKEQQDFFLAIESNYADIKSKIAPLICAEFRSWGNDFVIEDFDKEFPLESLTIPSQPSSGQWELSYTTVHDKNHWVIISFSHFEPVNVMIDG
jgi:hypothetical protein